MKYVPLKVFYKERLDKMGGNASPDEMGVADNGVRIGGYVSGHYRKAVSFRAMKERRKRVNGRLKKYAA